MPTVSRGWSRSRPEGGNDGGTGKARESRRADVVDGERVAARHPDGPAAAGGVADEHAAARLAAHAAGAAARAPARPRTATGRDPDGAAPGTGPGVCAGDRA